MILLLKVTLLLVAGGMGALLLSRRSAAARHLVWALTVTGALALTLATPLSRVFPIRIAGWPAVAVAAPGAALGTFALPSGPPDAPPTIRETTGGLAATRNIVSVARDSSLSPGWNVGLLLGLLWLLGAVTVAGWYAIGHARLARLAARATPVTSAEWRSLVVEVSGRIGLRGRVRLLRSGAAGSPLTWGALRPVVLLPEDAESWSEQRRRVVLAHELAHAVRGDYVTQIIACAACALYWFHPLVWVAARRLRLESERACDDQVITRGVTGVEYAAHLLDVARVSRALRLGGTVAIGMARSSQLEGRLLAAMDPARPRQSPPARARRAAWGGLGAFILPLAMLTPVARIVERPSESGAALTVNSPDPGAGAQPADRSDGPAAGPVRFRITEDSIFERSIRAAPAEQLELDLETGASVDIRGWDEPAVRVRGRLGGLNWRDSEVTLERTDGGVRLHAWQTGRRRTSSTSHHFEIRVPRRYDVHISSAGGRFMLADVEGRFDGETGGGGYLIERAKGEARLSTGGGDVRVSQSTLKGTISTGGGTVMISAVQGGLTGTSGSGPVVYAGEGSVDKGDLAGVRVGPDRDYVKDGRALTASNELHINKAGGAINLEEAPMGAEVSTGGGNVRVGRSRGFVSAGTGGGDIDIGPVAGSVKAFTGAGTVHVWITDARGEERLVDVQAGVGEVVLELPPGLSADFDLESGYTASFRRKSRIESDWALAESETDDWDDSNGQTPRKYVRARGSVGGGGPLIRVRTTNGNITVRRRRP